jgi:hypothetical protein
MSSDNEVAHTQQCNLWWGIDGDFVHAGIELYNPAARRAAPSGIYTIEPSWPRGRGLSIWVFFHAGIE